MSKQQIALTFDDGPSDATGRVLDALERATAKATFFIRGNMISGHERELERMAANGFQIGNHTWDHDKLNEASADELRRSVSRTNDAIYSACGVTPTVVRPPGGVCDDESLAVLGSMGLAAIFWNVDPRDWETQDAQSTVDHVLDRAKDGRVVIMHDIYEPTADAVEAIVPALVSRGFDLVTVDELAKDRGGLQLGTRFYGFR